MSADDGRTVANDDNDVWVKPAFAKMYRVLARGRFCVSFYGWNKADAFIAAWRAAGFRLVGHIVFRKRYASTSRNRARHQASPSDIRDTASFHLFATSGLRKFVECVAELQRSTIFIAQPLSYPQNCHPS